MWINGVDHKKITKTKKERLLRNFKPVMVCIWLALLVFILAVCFACCPAKEVVRIQTDTVERIRLAYIDRYQYDSIYLQDSIFLDRWKNGDTVFVEKYKYQILYREKLKIDSIYINDSALSKSVVRQLKTKIKQSNNLWWLFVVTGCVATAGVWLLLKKFNIVSKIKTLWKI